MHQTPDGLSIPVANFCSGGSLCAASTSAAFGRVGLRFLSHVPKSPLNNAVAGAPQYRPGRRLREQMNREKGLCSSAQFAREGADQRMGGLQSWKRDLQDCKKPGQGRASARRPRRHHCDKPSAEGRTRSSAWGGNTTREEQRKLFVRWLESFGEILGRRLGGDSHENPLAG